MRIIVLAFFITLPTLFYAQEFNAGLMLGLAPSQLDGDTYEGYHKFGYTGGAYVNRFFTKNTGMQFGLRFIEKGSRESDEQNVVYYRSVLRYAEMPVSFLYNFKKHFRFEVGFTLGYLIQAQEAKGDNYLEDAYPPFREYELGEIAGIHYRVNEKITIGIQHAYSITSVRPYSSNIEYMDYGQRNNVIIIGLNYTFKSWQ